MTKCPLCKKEFELQPDFCSSCGYPFLATDKEKTQFIAKAIIKKGKVNDGKDNIQKAQIVLFIMAGMNVVLPILKFANGQLDSTTLISSIVLGCVFLFFGIFIRVKPLLSILVPLIILIVIYLGSFIIEPSSIFRGVIWKIVCLTGLIYSFVTVSKAERLKKENEYLSSEK